MIQFGHWAHGKRRAVNYLTHACNIMVTIWSEYIEWISSFIKNNRRSNNAIIQINIHARVNKDICLNQHRAISEGKPWCYKDVFPPFFCLNKEKRSRLQKQRHQLLEVWILTKEKQTSPSQYPMTAGENEELLTWSVVSFGQMWPQVWILHEFRLIISNETTFIRES